MSQNQIQFSKLHGPSKTAKFQKERGKRKGIWEIQIGIKINYRYFLINDRGWAIIERNHCSALVKQFQTFVEDEQAGLCSCSCMSQVFTQIQEW